MAIDLLDLFSLSLDFKSKKIRINLNTPLKAEQKTEATDVLKTVDEDRKYALQATIVRYAAFILSSRITVPNLRSLL